jgi:Rrf2 family nitric oxide-sensitive transcriptional repressor
MRLTAFTDYGLRALMRLAGEPDRSFSTEEIAREFQLSRHHLTKIVAALAEAGIVSTQRGAGGGFRLARAPQKISLGEIVRVLEADQVLVECFAADGGDCMLLPGCRLRKKLADAREAFYRELDRTSLAECAFPKPRSSRRMQLAS